MTHSNHFIIKLSRTKTNKLSLHLYSYLTPLSIPKVLRFFTALSNLSLHSMNLMSVLTHGTFLIKTKSHLLQTATNSRYPSRPNHIWICTINNLSCSTNIVLLLNSVHNNILLNHIRYLIELHTKHDKSFFVILYYTFIIKLQFFLETQDLHKPSFVNLVHVSIPNAFSLLLVTLIFVHTTYSNLISTCTGSTRPFI